LLKDRPTVGSITLAGRQAHGGVSSDYVQGSSLYYSTFQRLSEEQNLHEM
jgi:hypothetical protein